MGRVNERDIKKDVTDVLKVHKFMKTCIWFERLNCGKVRTEWGSWMMLCEKGTPDHIALMFDGDIAHVVFIETKKPGENIEKGSAQDRFRDTVTGYLNVHHLEVDDVQALKQFLSDLTSKKVQRQLDQISL